jgi:hypothetical protein
VAKRVFGSWKEISDREVSDLLVKIQTFVNEIMPIDCDNDPAIELHYVDRRKRYMSWYQPTPYLDHDKEASFKEVEGVLLQNLETAVKELNKFRVLEKRHNENL